MASNLVGKRIGRYRVVRGIGAGATGEVYRAVGGRGESSVSVAIKVLSEDLSRDPEMVERFRREAATAQRLEHPGIVRVLDVGSVRGRHYFAMELLQGKSFRQLLRRGKPAGRILLNLAQVAEALAFAHTKGVVHRDVKPENVLLARRRAKVADFGLARVTDASTLTTDGTTLGTAHYMSPEQARGQRAGPPSDVYSLGVMIYEAISGDLPFSSDTQFGFIYQHVVEAPPPPRVRSGYPSGLSRLALRCLAKDPALRPPMSDVANALHRAAGQRLLGRPLRIALAGLGTLAAILAVLTFSPPLLDPLCEADWFGRESAVELRDFVRALHERVTGLYGGE